MNEINELRMDGQVDNCLDEVEKKKDCMTMMEMEDPEKRKFTIIVMRLFYNPELTALSRKVISISSLSTSSVSLLPYQQGIGEMR